MIKKHEVCLIATSLPLYNLHIEDVKIREPWSACIHARPELVLHECGVYIRGRGLIKKKSAAFVDIMFHS